MLAVKSYDTGDLSGAVSLRFRHVLSYVTVSVQNAYNENIRVSKLELRNIHKAGSLKLEEDTGTDASKGIPAGETGFRYDANGQEQVILWEPTDNVGHDAAANKIEFALEGADGVTVHEGATVSLTGNTNGLFVLPQSIAGNGDDVLEDGETYIHVEYATYSEPSVTLTEDIRLDLAAFEAGRRYTVVTSLFDPDHDPAAVNVWAASNIYFKPDVDGGAVGSLTFAESKAGGTIGGKEGYQGVFFKWGSLVGVSPGSGIFKNTDYLFIPDLTTGKYYKVAVGDVGTSNIQAAIDFRTSSAVTALGGWNGSGGYDTWDAIPYAYSDIPDDTDNRTNSLLTDYSSSLRASYKGDICSYLSVTKSTSGSGLSGNWKMPASYMFGEDDSGYADETVALSTGIAENGTSTVSTNIKKYTYGSETVYFPVNNFRDGSSITSSGNSGYWSSSAKEANAYCMAFSFSGGYMVPNGDILRAYGFGLRCVRE
jgi:hypothetical protein